MISKITSSVWKIFFLYIFLISIKMLATSLGMDTYI